MEAINTALSASSSSAVTSPNSMAELGGEEFLKLLIMQLQQQDPFEPMDNSELLQQISSIRDIELSTSLTASLSTLTDQQRFASASSFIGKYVTGVSNGSGVAEGAIVIGVRFTDAGQPVLQLSNGGEMSVDQVVTIQTPLEVAQSLVGQTILGLDRRDPEVPQVVAGVVAGVRSETSGEVYLELDTGEDLRLRDFVRVGPAEAI